MNSPIRYERVHLEDGRTLLLRLTADRAGYISGIEVRKDGDEVKPRGADERLHVIAHDAIKHRTPLVMDLKYAELREQNEVL